MEATQVAEAIRKGEGHGLWRARHGAGVAKALDEIPVPFGPTPATLKAEGRYVEDVY
ncbi:MAG: hypothetical protein R3D61_10170 [Defluviimonas denitrificans]